LTQGRTKKEARENLREALMLILLEERAKLSKKDKPVERENFRIDVGNLVAA
jgi:predicted RNase H-like HicB family nuclease